MFSNVWLCFLKCHRKHIFYLLLTFSQLPNEYIISFLPKNTNKTQKRSHFLGEIAIAIGAIAIAQSVDRDRDRDRRRLAQFRWSRSRSMPIVLSLSRAECVLFAWVFSFCGSLSLLRFFRKSFEGKTTM